MRDFELVQSKTNPDVYFLFIEDDLHPITIAQLNRLNMDIVALINKESARWGSLEEAEQEIEHVMAQE